MNKPWAVLLCGFILCLGSHAGVPNQQNLNTHTWPFRVNWEETETSSKYTFIGPIGEGSKTEKESLFALRPFYLNRTYHDDISINYTKSILYPLFIYRNYPGHEQWNVLSLIRRSKIEVDIQPRLETDIVSHYRKSFEVFPFYFDHDSYNPEYDYFGIFPLWGELKNRLFHKRISWAAFPMYSEWERKDEKTYAFLWPIIRYRTGPHSKGFSVWPLFGSFQRENDYHQRYALWPLLYYHQTQLYQETPTTQIGVLPFYARETRLGYIKEDFLWPFFGYTNDSNSQYKEVRVLYPIIAQGRGSDRYLNQIAPLYSISQRNGKNSTWLLWPLFNHKSYHIKGIHTNKYKFFYFLYQSTTQNLSEDPTVRLGAKRHLWPLFSYWENHEGAMQFQFLSPIEPLLPTSTEMRKNYSPLFSIYRYHKQSDQHKDMDMLFSLIHFERRPTHERLELGPLFGYEYGETTKRFDILKGLIGFKNENGKNTLRLLWINIDLATKAQKTRAEEQ